MASASTANCLSATSVALRRADRGLGERNHLAPDSRRLVEPAVAPASQAKPIEALTFHLDRVTIRRAAIAGGCALDEPRTLVDPADRQSLRSVGTTVGAVLDEAHGASRDGGERDQIQPVVLEHRLERTRIAAAHELKEARWDLESRHISDPSHIEQRALERRQAAAALGRVVRTRPPQPAGGVQRVEVRDSLERHRHAMKEPARLHHRHVEGLAVVADDQLRIVEELRDGGEKRPLRRVTRQQELPDLKGAEVVEPAPDEKRHGAGAAAEAGRFEVDEDACAERGAKSPRECERGPAPDNADRSGDSTQGWVQHSQTAHIVDLAFGNPHVAVPAIGFVASIDDKALAEVVARGAAAEDLANAVNRWRGLVSAVVGLVGELAASRQGYGAPRRPRLNPVA